MDRRTKRHSSLRDDTCLSGYVSERHGATDVLPTHDVGKMPTGACVLKIYSGLVVQIPNRPSVEVERQTC
jgi:hypothetical protein